MALEVTDTMHGHESWRYECRTMARAFCEVLRCANEPVTPANIIRFVSSLPRKPSDLMDTAWQQKYCFTYLDKAHETMKPELKDVLFECLLVHFPNQTWQRQETLIDAFVGILSGIEGNPCFTSEG
jgi:hypothetical protein